MKKVFSIFLLFLFLFNTMGYYVAYEIITSNIKRSMEKVVKSEVKKNAQFIVVPDNLPFSEFRWIKKHEFLYHGKMYDVVSMERKGGNYHFLCIHDKKEDKLIAGMKKMRSEDKKLLLSLFSHIVLIAVSNARIILEEPLPESSDLRWSQQNYCSAYILVPESPPPRNFHFTFFI